MYGTVMIARIKGNRDAMEQELTSWVSALGSQAGGFVDSSLLFARDGRTVVNTVRYSSREDYERLAHDPVQSLWFAERIAPLIQGDARWFDGYWFDPQVD
jgi:hypothetical protein